MEALPGRHGGQAVDRPRRRAASSYGCTRTSTATSSTRCGWASRIAFLSDHEGVGALYSSLPDGSDLRRHTPLDGFYARHAATDGTRVVYASAGELWLLDDLDGAEPRRLDIRLGGQRADLQPHPVSAARWFGAAAPGPHRPRQRRRGRAAPSTGSPTAPARPARSPPSPAYAPGCRAPSAPSGEEQVVWVTDAEGDDALEFAPATGAAPGATPRRLAAGAARPGPRPRRGTRRQPRRRRLARRTGAARRARDRRGPRGRPQRGRRRLRPGLLARLGLARLVAPRPAPAAPAPARQHHRPVGDRGDPAALPGLRARRSPSTASTSPSCPSAPSTRSTTRTSSTWPSSAAAART